MNRLLDVSTARALDSFTISKGHASEARLMRAAGRSVAIEAAKMISADMTSRITVVCGKGHNGGDGLAAAQFLRAWGYNCHVALVVPLDDLDPTVAEFTPADEDHLISAAKAEDVDLAKNGLVIDALLGLGSSGPLRTEIEEWVAAINQFDGKVLAVDIPTGLHGDTGQISGSAVIADRTVTMGVSKLGLLVNAGPDYAGEVVEADIGFSAAYFETRDQAHFTFDRADFLDLFVPPARQTYKHRQGKILVVAGSLGMTGAAELASGATFRSGNGLTIAACPLSLEPIYAAAMAETITLGLDDHGVGLFLPEHVSLLHETLAWSTALVLGPGLSRAPQCQEFARKMIEYLDVPTILDADGLSPFDGEVDLLNMAQHPLVVTPHAGEFAKLFDHDLADVQADPVKALHEVGSYFHHTVVLKGAPTVVLLSSGDIVINRSGNPGMATAGSGDVLSGIVGTFLSQGYSADEAALMGVWLHGRAGDIAAERLGAPGMTATDLLNHVPLALAQQVSSS